MPKEKILASKQIKIHNVRRDGKLTFVSYVSTLQAVFRKQMTPYKTRILCRHSIFSTYNLYRLLYFASFLAFTGV